MLKLCKLRSRDRARDHREANNSLLVLELTYYKSSSLPWTYKLYVYGYSKVFNYVHIEINVMVYFPAWWMNENDVLF